jgi:uncharacterized protein YjbJ (UPF0337 family)
MAWFALDANADELYVLATSRSNGMNQNTRDGDLKQVKGSVKEALGKVVGNENLEAEGATEKAVGKAQKDIGKIQETVREAARKATD